MPWHITVGLFHTHWGKWFDARPTSSSFVRVGRRDTKTAVFFTNVRYPQLGFDVEENEWMLQQLVERWESGQTVQEAADEVAAAYKARSEQDVDDERNIHSASFFWALELSPGTAEVVWVDRSSTWRVRPGAVPERMSAPHTLHEKAIADGEQLRIPELGRAESRRWLGKDVAPLERVSFALDADDAVCMVRNDVLGLAPQAVVDAVDAGGEETARRLLDCTDARSAFPAVVVVARPSDAFAVEEHVFVEKESEQEAWGIRGVNVGG